MSSSVASLVFSGTYAEARAKFLDAAAGRGARVESIVLDGHAGALGETLATDAARIGAADAPGLLIVSSGVHGPEGFCGSAAQLAALADDELIARLAKAGVALLLVHAVNPHGFSHLHRGDADNIDPNRNCIDFTAPPPANDAYAEVDGFLLPATWPPSAADDAAMAAYIGAHGMAGFQEAVTLGQYAVPDGFCYGGAGPSWSNRTMRNVLRRHGGTAQRIGWIDIHTGLGPFGHGEKIYAGRASPADLARARAWWGADVFAPFEGKSVSADVSGPVVTTVYDECPNAAAAAIGLEFGSLPMNEVLQALRADHWLRRHPEAPDAQKRAIRRQVRDAFYCDDAVWKGMVLGQSRTAILQAIQGLGDAAFSAQDCFTSETLDSENASAHGVNSVQKGCGEVTERLERKNSPA